MNIYMPPISQAITRGLTDKDSIDVLKNYAESWVRKKLLLEKANENIPSDDPAISKKVDDYRESLVLYEYEKALVNKKINSNVPPDELQFWSR